MDNIDEDDGVIGAEEGDMDQEAEENAMAMDDDDTDEDEDEEDNSDEGDDGPQRTPGIFVIPKIQDVISIEDQIVPGTGDSAIGQTLENYISAIEQCPFHGLDSINYDEVNEVFSEIFELVELFNYSLLGAEKIPEVNNALKMQVDSLNEINFDRLWTRFAKTDELPETTWAQIDQNDALAVNEFCQAYERKMSRVHDGFQECVLRTISISTDLAEVKHYVGLLGLWDSVKGHYDHSKVPELEEDENESENVIPSVFFPRLKANLLEKSKMLLDPVWTHGTRFQLLHHNDTSNLETIIYSDLEWGLHSLRHGVSFGDGTRTLGTLKSEQETAAFETFLLDLDEETKELVRSSIAKFTELENDVVELEKLRDQTILAVILLMDI